MNNSVEIYRSGGKTQIEVRFEKETVWLSLNQISELFGCDKSVVSRYLKKIYADGELKRSATVAKNATVQIEGKRKVEREIETYNLDAILSVGYRVNSKQGTQFRICPYYISFTKQFRFGHNFPSMPFNVTANVSHL